MSYDLNVRSLLVAGLLALLVSTGACGGFGDDDGLIEVEWASLGELVFVVGAVQFDGEDNVIVFADSNSLDGRRIYRYRLATESWELIEVPDFFAPDGELTNFFSEFDVLRMVTGQDGALYGFDAYAGVCRLIRLRPSAPGFETVTVEPTPDIEGARRPSSGCGDLVAVSAQGEALVVGSHIEDGSSVGLHRYHPGTDTWELIDSSLHFGEGWSAGSAVVDGTGNVYIGVDTAPRGLYLLPANQSSLAPLIACDTEEWRFCQGYPQWAPVGDREEGVWVFLRDVDDRVMEMLHVDVQSGEVVETLRFPETLPDGNRAQSDSNVLFARGMPRLPSNGTLFTKVGQSLGGLSTAHSVWRRRPGKNWQMIHEIKSPVYAGFVVSPQGRLYKWRYQVSGTIDAADLD